MRVTDEYERTRLDEASRAALLRTRRQNLDGLSLEAKVAALAEDFFATFEIATVPCTEPFQDSDTCGSTHGYPDVLMASLSQFLARSEWFDGEAGRWRLPAEGVDRRLEINGQAVRVRFLAGLGQFSDEGLVAFDY